MNGVPQATPPHWMWCFLLCQLVEGTVGLEMSSARAPQHPFFKANFLKLPHPHFSWGGYSALCFPCSFPCLRILLTPRVFSGHRGKNPSQAVLCSPVLGCGPETNPAPLLHSTANQPDPGYAWCSSHPDGSYPA